MNNIDSRGVKRGRCDCENCDQFEWTFGYKSSNCDYCGCLPVKHTKLDAVHMPALQVSNDLEVISLDEPMVDEPMYLDINAIPIITPDQLCSNSVNEEQGVEEIASNFELQNSNVYLAREDGDDSLSNVEKSSNEKHVYETECHLNQSAASSDLSNNNTDVIKETVLECLVSRNLPDNLKRLIKAGAQLKESEKSVIIRLTCKNMLSYNMTNSGQISKMSEILCLNFPFLEGPYGLKHVQVEQKMKSCLKYFKSVQNESKSSNFSHKTLCSEMEKETRSSLVTPPNVKKLKKLLDETRETRNKEINKQSASTFFKTYPALMKSELLIWEFSKVVEVPVIELRANWMDAIPKILSYIEIAVDADVNLDGQCVHVLLNLTKVFNSFKAKADNQKILIIHPGGTELETMCAQSDPPRLLGIESITFNDIKLQCYVDGVCAFSANAFDAVLLLLALYWVLNIAFSVSSRLQLSFIAMAVLRKAGIKKGLLDILKMPAFTKLLNKVELID